MTEDIDTIKAKGQVEICGQIWSGEPAAYDFYVSDAAEKFKKFANSILPYDVDKTQAIDIEDY